jgi:hypothetical protein
MEVHLKIARELDYVTDGEYREFVEEYQTIGKQLTRLIQYWRSRSDEATSS